MSELIVPGEFYARSALDAARELIGKEPVRVTPEGMTRGIIAEAEAYRGLADPAAYVLKGSFKMLPQLLF